MHLLRCLQHILYRLASSAALRRRLRVASVQALSAHRNRNSHKATLCGCWIARSKGLVLTVTNSLTLTSAAGHGSPAPRSKRGARRMAPPFKPLTQAKQFACSTAQIHNTLFREGVVYLRGRRDLNPRSPP